VIYTESGGKWNRRVIFDKVSSGHEIAVVDLNGDGRDDVVANDNGRVSAQPHPWMGFPASLTLTLPPLAALVLLPA